MAEQQAMISLQYEKQLRLQETRRLSNSLFFYIIDSLQFRSDPDTFSTSAPAIRNAIFQHVRELRVTLDKLL
jgi:hypothetical protein